jgi:serine/threonine protein kinase
MLTGVPPFYEQDREKLFKSIKNEEPDYPGELSESCVDLLQGLLTKDPAQRLGCRENGADDIINHPWFSIVDWDALYERKIVPPFKPKLHGSEDTKYVDSEFTELEPVDSATGETILAGSQTGKWEGFTFEGKGQLD